MQTQAPGRGPATRRRRLLQRPSESAVATSPSAPARHGPRSPCRQLRRRRRAQGDGGIIHRAGGAAARGGGGGAAARPAPGSRTGDVRREQFKLPREYEFKQPEGHECVCEASYLKGMSARVKEKNRCAYMCIAPASRQGNVRSAVQATSRTKKGMTVCACVCACV